jgi:hypothetical protein
LDHEVREGEANWLVRFLWLVAAQQRRRRAAEVAAVAMAKERTKKNHDDLGHIYRHGHDESHWKARVVALAFPGAREKVLDAARRLAGAHAVRCRTVICRAL